MSKPPQKRAQNHWSSRGPRALVGLALALLLAAGSVLGGSQSASALSEGVAFSAADSPTWQTNGVVYALGSSNGRVVAGGTFDQIRPPEGGAGTPQSVSALAILDAATGNPSSCQIPVAYSAGTPSVRAITVSPDGDTVYIGGQFTSVGNKPAARVAAIDVVNCTVKSYRALGVNAPVYGLAIHDNTLYMAGQFTEVNNQPRSKFAATNATTGAVLPFVADADKPGRAVAVSPDGKKLAIGGDISIVNGQYSHSIAIVDATTGANIKTYGPGFVDPTSQTKGIYSPGDGKFYISNEAGYGFEGRAAINWSDGEEAWRDGCIGATQAVTEYEGTIYSVSHAHNCAPNEGFQDGKRNFFLAETATKGKLLGWYPQANDGTGEGIGPRAIIVARGATASGDQLYSGGEFTRINGKLQQGLTRFGRNDSAKPSTPQLVSRTMSDGSIQLRARTVVDDDDNKLTYRVFRNGSVDPVWEGQATSVWWKRPQVTFVDSDVTPGTTYGYVMEVTDGTHTVRSSRVNVKAEGVTSGAYETAVRQDSPISFWRSQLTGSWVEDASATKNTGKGLSGLASGPARSSESAVADDNGTGSFTYDGRDDFLWEDNYQQGPNTYSTELWFKTTTRSGGKLIGFGNARPRTDNGAMPLSGSYDRHVYMGNDGRLSFGVYDGGTRTIRSGNSYNDGQWHHVVTTQGDQGMKLFVDSQLLGTNPTTIGDQTWGVWHVGGDNTGGWPNRGSSNYFAGQIDEVAIYDKQLGSGDVTRHYKAGGANLIENEAPKDAFGAQAFADDPALFWRLDDGSSDTAKDSSFTGERPGSYGSSMTRGAQGIPGSEGNSAVGFSGNPAQGVATKKAAVPPTAFTAEVWFNTTSTSGGKLLGYENVPTGQASSYDKQIYMENNGKLRFGTYYWGVSTVQSPKAYNDGKWHQAVAQLSAEGTKLFVDGKLVDQNGQTRAETGSGYWRLGNGIVNGWPGNVSNGSFDGRLDEALIYHSALTPAQINEHFVLGTTEIEDTEAPSKPASLTAEIDGTDVSLNWEASSDNVGVTGYEVHRGTSADFTPDTTSRIDTVNAATWSTTEHPFGDFFYKVIALDAAENASAASEAVAVNVADPSVTTVALDATEAAAVYESVPNNNYGTNTQLWARGTSGQQSFLKFDLPAAPAGKSIQSAKLQLRTSSDAGAPSNDEMDVNIVSGTWSESSLTWNNRPINVGAKLGATEPIADRNTAFDVNLAGAPMNAWADRSLTLRISGDGSDSLRMWSDDARSDYRPELVVTYGDGGEITDTEAPSKPASLAADVDGSDVNLTWTASTDDTEVTRYSVYRGDTAGFEPSSDNRIGTSSSTGYVNRGVELGTYFYKVVAFDAAGNGSEASGAAEVTIAKAPTKLTATAIADAAVYATGPDVNRGSYNQLFVRGDSAQESLVSFSVPTNPEGQTLAEAELRIKTSTDGTAGSASTFNLDLVSDDWSEDAVTWNNRPTTVVEKVGEITDATTPNTEYTITLDAAKLADYAGSTVTVRISADDETSKDNLRLFSSDYAAAVAPKVELTYS